MVENETIRIQIDRPLYESEQLNKEFQYAKSTPKHSLLKVPRSHLSHNIKDIVLKTIPVLKWLPNYKWRENFTGDLISGFTVAVMHIPQGMAYSLLGNLPPVVGIYMALFPVIVYFFLGTSRHISMGTFAIVSLMTGKAVLEYSNPAYFLNTTSSNEESTQDILTYNYHPMEVVTAVTFLVALFQLLMFIFRLGVVSSLLSEALISGFTTAATVQVLTSQIKDLLGISIPKHKGYFAVINTWISVIQRIGTTNTAALLISVITITIVVLNNELLKPKLAKYTSIPVPIELIAVVLGTVVSQYCEMSNLYSITVVGHIPSGLPEPTVPNFSLMTTVAFDALTIAIVSYAMALSMALIFSQKLSYEVDANQELLAMGAGNIVGSFFSCMPFTASISRSVIQQTVGGKTQIASLISCGILFCVIMWIGPLFEPLPKCVLASVIVVSLKSMIMQVTDLPTFWKLNKLDAVVWLVTFLTVVLVSIDIGLLVGLLLSLSTIIWLGFKPYTCLLGVAPNTDIYLDATRYGRVLQIKGVKIFHYRGGINFATKTIFKEKMFEAVEVEPQKELIKWRKLAKLITLKELNSTAFTKPKLKHKFQKLSERARPDIKYLVWDFSAVSFIDPSGVLMLKQLSDDFSKINVQVYIANCSGPVFDTITKCSQQYQTQANIKFFPTVVDAVESATTNLEIVNYL